MSIKYHDNTVYPKYGEDHKLLNNWNPDKDYGNEYVRVYFRMETNGYDYPDFSFNDDDRAAFNNDVKTIFTNMGWSCEAQKISGASQTWTNGKSHLYTHPQDFSGEVLKNEVKMIAEALESGKSFKLRWVDLYDTVYDITDEEYEEILSTKDDEIKRIILELCKTNRRNQFYHLDGAVKRVSDKVRLFRIGIDDGQNFGNGQTADHVRRIVDCLADDGYVVIAENRDGKLIRTINKTEQRQRKLFIA